MSELSKNEGLKENSRGLRGTIAQGLGQVETGALSEDDTQLTKFHGIYQQDDRDLRPERRRQKMEKAYSFMIRVRVPGGVATPGQWLHMDRIARTLAHPALRLTTRQAFQFHGVIKTNLKRAMQEINASALDTLAACGDVNRNVMAPCNPEQSGAHEAAVKLAREISDHLSPRTSAYHEIWLDGEKISGGEAESDEVEPIYGKTYLPRKFKTVVAVPPVNDVDIFAHDMGFSAVWEEDGLKGWNVTVGGGMGTTHGDEDTFPRAADVMGFCTPDQALLVAEHIVTVQRDWGNRSNRKRARLKYTIEDHGLDAFRAEVEKRCGFKLGKPRPMVFTQTGDVYGWTRDADGHWGYTLYIQNGRVADFEDRRILSGLRAIAEVHEGDFRLTPNQNVMIGRIAPRAKKKIEALLAEYGLINDQGAIRLNAMACVALPTCGLALAESERYLPDLITRIEKIAEDAGLKDDPITIRMTGCPNGCARPFLAEIGFVGRTPGVYNLYLGAAYDGSRLNKLYARDVKEPEILAKLTPLIQAYAKDRKKGERFGDFVIRTGVIQPTPAGNRFHADLNADLAA